VGHWKDKYVIGITGNIATGKSVVRKMLQHLGAYTIDADGLAHQVMAPNAPAYRPVIDWFGKWIVGQDGRIDRGRLGAVVFSHPVALKRLETITHPVIGQAIDTLISRSQHKVVVVEAIKLLEGDLADKVDAVWVVDAHPKVQLQRLVQKRGLPQEEGVKRIRLQNPQAAKLKAASVVIQNNGDVNETWSQVQAAWDQIQAQLAPAPPAQQPASTPATPPAPAQQQAQPPAPAQQPEPTLAAARSTPAPVTPTTENIQIRRPRREDLGELADLFNDTKGIRPSEADIIMSFTETSYLVAEYGDKMIGSVGFVVENLISQSSDIVVLPGIAMEPVLSKLVAGMEDAAQNLQAEVSFIYLNDEEDAQMIALLRGNLGYETTQLEDIDFTAWREAVRASQPIDTIILSKKLREERVLTPF
jgi:dephospho-CoA kinase